MASPPPFEAEDQTDEDFFDKLVDDEFGNEGSSSKTAEIARDLSNLSLGEVGNSMDDSGDAGFASEVDHQQESRGFQSSEALNSDIFGIKGGGSFDSSDEKGVHSGGSSENMTEVGSQGSLATKSVGSKGTSVKEVQWSAFSVNPQQADKGASESYSDFLTGNAGGSADVLKADAVLNSSFVENPSENLSAYASSSEQPDAQLYGMGTEQNAHANDGQYWDNLYPGWKFDASTGQWYQVDICDANTNAHFDGYDASIGNTQGGYEDKAQVPVDKSISERSDVSYLHKTTQSVLETIAEDSTVNSFSNWNQVSHGSLQYPPHMVFDPQYPGWYYDTNTQQWYTLESYTGATPKTTGIVQDQWGQDVNNLVGFTTEQNCSSHNEVCQAEQSTVGVQVSQEFRGEWDDSTGRYAQQNMWQPEPAGKSGQTLGFSGSQQTGSFYGSTVHAGYQTDQQIGFKAFEPVGNYNYSSSNSVAKSQGFVPAESTYQFSQSKVEQSLHEHLSNSYYGDPKSLDYSQQSFQGASASNSQFSYGSVQGRSSAGRPAHALVSFGFGGKVIVMKDVSSFSTTMDYQNQGNGGAISVLSLTDIVMEKVDASSIYSFGTFGYFHALCQQSFPGPLVGGNAATKDINKWIDERIASCESPGMDIQKGELLRLLLSLLKISCQHYGKLRSPFGSDPSLEGTDGPEMAVTKLFASAKTKSGRLGDYASFSHCMQSLPSEGQMQATAIEVQNFLVSGRRKEALQCAQEGQLWGPALVLAAQLGEKFYVDTVRNMAHHQFISGTPLRTLCLLIAGQPADVFAAGSSIKSTFGPVNAHQQPSEIQANGMLDDWEENLAIITANRTKDDELVMIHLGDCLWKEKGDVTAAHTCYLVAEANFESYSDQARLCLIGADHWKYPRTFASPDAIQRTELFEYSKVLGNSQFVLLPFQPYKLVYAYMLAELGKVSESLRYCQASLKLLKNSVRASEVELWKSLLSSLEERLRTHQQGGYGTNLAPSKLVGKFFTSIDRSIHRMMGAPPPPLPPMPPMPPMPQGSANDKENYFVAPKFANSQSTMAMSSLIPSASVEGISEWKGDANRKSMHNRSISEPDFGRSPKQDAADAAQSRASSGGSRFGRIGSQLLQKTMGWVSKSHRQAKLGEQNKFYYDDKLKRWVEEGVEPPAEEAALPPPPTVTSFQNGMADYNINNALKSENVAENGGPETKSSGHSEQSPGIPPIPPSQNQFSARSRIGVRSRYVDTFNKGGVAVTKSFQSPAAPSVKPAAAAKFFIPTAPAASSDDSVAATVESRQETTTHEEPSTSVPKETPFFPRPPSSSSFMPRYPSMDNVAHLKNVGPVATSMSGNGPLSRTRAASWSGNYTDTLNPIVAEIKAVGDGQSVASSFVPNNISHTRSSSSSSLQLNGGSLGDDLQEVEL